ncbi:ATP-dependent DNA helicase RecG [Pseudalkalibacillus salsuginis]|uniref:ATP-dependent DNA helicase RecG n=1 Tax=Pseudalkalibacillus salsuginis TaxID=2910972 RepID=UPI001F218952|nr:ATP-dependent DNA helicase RecG [Pseudalkalibacillus salsuginis]MCF6410529.1 ATP-dependent DNA helicase RecG [Pseudalkalibacillus salsuginis]
MDLSLPVTHVKGIGEARGEELADLKVYTVNDLLMYFPYRYEDFKVRDLTELKHDEKATIEGKVHSEPSLRYFGRKKSRLTVRVLVGKYLVTAVFFNRAFLKKQLAIGQPVTITGKWDQNRLTITAQHVVFGHPESDETIEPVYSIKGDWTVKRLRKVIRLCIQQYLDSVEDILPEELRKQYKLVKRREAIQWIHTPVTHDHLKHARRYFVYEELLMFQLKMQWWRKQEKEKSDGIERKFNQSEIESFIGSLPFPLTGAQNRVVDEILKDLRSPYRMNRLLQGDVGSGKTIVAAISMYALVTTNMQSALMVPTEILAEQHCESMTRLFNDFNIEVELLTSSIKGKRRKDILERVRSGDVDILIGTHALIQDEVQFSNLGLVITDEQHRFGVEQRKVLRLKGMTPDVLFMTATPIPRTLAISVFGDMDVSTIDEMPAGRKPIETYWAKHGMLDRVLGFIEKELNRGRQAYVICPLIEESDKLDFQNAVDVHAQLVHYFTNFNVGLMHGRLSFDEKEEIMARFSKNQVQVLVSTTVVEVGVNVPNASVMVVYDAERFGLSQLHQLRGRVGRGDAQSYCILIADPKSDVGKERMQIMTETNDGFELSQRDLELRGPGDFFGKKQSGLPDFKVADLVHDYRALEVARNDAAKMVNSEVFWKDPQYDVLRNWLLEQVEVWEELD